MISIGACAFDVNRHVYDVNRCVSDVWCVSLCNVNRCLCDASYR